MGRRHPRNCRRCWTVKSSLCAKCKASHKDRGPGVPILAPVIAFVRSCPRCLKHVNNPGMESGGKPSGVWRTESGVCGECSVENGEREGGVERKVEWKVESECGEWKCKVRWKV